MNGYFATAIKLLRKENSKTQKECAKKIGISQSSYSRRESGELPWTIDDISRAAAAIGVTERVIFERAFSLREKVKHLYKENLEV